MINHVKLKQSRIEAGFKLQGLATEIGISRQALWMIEEGKVNPKIENLRKLCDILKLDANEILMVKEG
uniref:Putative DNA binding, helix-turn-helix domain containing protein n=1 Tax=viral metagenome TaxID=1070528 RepID=A0A6M3LIP3_9ZZZZ